MVSSDPAVRWRRWMECARAEGRTLRRLLVHVDDWRGELVFEGVPVEVFGIRRLVVDEE